MYTIKMTDLQTEHHLELLLTFTSIAEEMKKMNLLIQTQNSVLKQIAESSAKTAAVLESVSSTSGYSPAMIRVTGS